jgi:DNA-binding beta-propeller fold protein YncE
VWTSVQLSDTILRIDPNDGSTQATIDGGPTVSGLAITRDQVWVANQGGTTIDRIDPASNKIVSHVEVGDAPFWFAVGDDKVLASLTSANSVVIIDARTGQAGEPIGVGQVPHDPGFVDGSFWMPNQQSGDVSVIDPSTESLVGSFTPPAARGIFLADQALGDGWVLDYAGVSAYRYRAMAGQP